LSSARTASRCESLSLTHHIRQGLLEQREGTCPPKVVPHADRLTAAFA
jgi:hypothetical protein